MPSDITLLKKIMAVVSEDSVGFPDRNLIDARDQELQERKDHISTLVKNSTDGKPSSDLLPSCPLVAHHLNPIIHNNRNISRNDFMTVIRLETEKQLLETELTRLNQTKDQINDALAKNKTSMNEALTKIPKKQRQEIHDQLDELCEDIEASLAQFKDTGKDATRVYKRTYLQSQDLKQQLRLLDKKLQFLQAKKEVIDAELEAQRPSEESSKLELLRFKATWSTPTDSNSGQLIFRLLYFNAILEKIEQEGPEDIFPSETDGDWKTQFIEDFVKQLESDLKSSGDLHNCFSSPLRNLTDGLKALKKAHREARSTKRSPQKLSPQEKNQAKADLIQISVQQHIRPAIEVLLQHDGDSSINNTFGFAAPDSVQFERMMLMIADSNITKEDLINIFGLSSAVNFNVTSAESIYTLLKRHATEVRYYQLKTHFMEIKELYTEDVFNDWCETKIKKTYSKDPTKALHAQFDQLRVTGNVEALELQRSKAKTTLSHAVGGYDSAPKHTQYHHPKDTDPQIHIDTFTTWATKHGYIFHIEKTEKDGKTVLKFNYLKESEIQQHLTGEQEIREAIRKFKDFDQGTRADRNFKGIKKPYNGIEFKPSANQNLRFIYKFPTPKEKAVHTVTENFKVTLRNFKYDRDFSNHVQSRK